MPWFEFLQNPEIINHSAGVKIALTLKLFKDQNNSIKTSQNFSSSFLLLMPGYGFDLSDFTGNINVPQLLHVELRRSLIGTLPCVL